MEILDRFPVARGRQHLNIEIATLKWFRDHTHSFMSPNWQKIADDLLGTSGVYDQAHLDEHNIELDVLEEKLEECGVVRCSCCGWWVETSECEGDEPTCEDCRSE